MGAPNIRTIAGLKAATTTTDLATYGGLLVEEQADRMIDMIIPKAAFLSDVNIVRMNSHKRKMDKVGITSTFLYPSTAGVAVTHTGFATDYVDLIVSDWRGVMPIYDDVLEDNPERAALTAHLENLVTKKCAIEMQHLSLVSDTSSVDTRLQQFDGLIKQIETNTIDHTASPQPITDDVLDRMLEEIPAEWFDSTDEEDWRFYCHRKQLLGYARWMSDRGTPLGDDAVVKRLGKKSSKGIPLFPLSQIPESKIILTHKDNAMIGIRRWFKFETQRYADLEETRLVVSCRFDAKWENEAACVLYDGVTTQIVPTI